MIRRKDPENKKEREKNKKYNFQGQLAESRRWFDLDHEWLEENFMSREPNFYRIFYKKIGVDDTKTSQICVLPIGNSKTTEKVQFHPEAPVIKYHQNSSNSCCLSSVASDFHFIGDNRAVTALVNRIEESLKLHTRN